MRIKIIIFLSMFLVYTSGFSQIRPTTRSVDSTTYAYWSQGDWNSLIRAGNEALEQGINFYYLQYRLGIAWYEKRNYHRATGHFKAAMNMNDEDEVLNEYLYYSYLFSGWDYEAAHLERTFSDRLRNKMDLAAYKNLKKIYFAYSFHPGASTSVTNQFDPATEVDGYQTITTGYHLFNTGIEHRLGSRFWLHHSFTNIRKSYFHFYNMNDTRFLDPNDKSTINQYYLGSTTLLRPGTDLRFGFHFIHLLDYEHITDVTPDRHRSQAQPITSQNLVGFLSLYHRFNYLASGITSTVGNLNQSTQLQQDLLITLYPFGNSDLYSTSTLSYQMNKIDNDNWSNEFIYHQTIGYKLYKKVWSDAEVSFGNILNHFSSDGYVVFNDTDVIKRRYGLGMYTVITPQIHFRLNYTYLKKESRFIAAQHVVHYPGTIHYDTNTATATIIWKR